MFIIDIPNFKNNISSLVNFVVGSNNPIIIKTKNLLSENNYRGFKDSF